MSKNLAIKDMAKSERPREKLISSGIESLSNAELLAILLRTGTKEQSAIDLARQILSHETNGIEFWVDRYVEKLCTIKGRGVSKACQLISSIE